MRSKNVVLQHCFATLGLLVLLSIAKYSATGSGRSSLLGKTSCTCIWHAAAMAAITMFFWYLPSPSSRIVARRHGGHLARCCM